MNYSTAIFLINPNARAILAIYEAEDNAKRELFKTLDADIQVGDLVLVETTTRHNMTVCKVVGVDVDFDIESSATVRWVISKVNQQDYKELQSLESKAIQAIKSAEMRKKREELAKALLQDAKAQEIENLRLAQGSEVKIAALPNK